MSRRVAGILLAAGRSSRMGGPNKLLLRLKSGTLVGHTADELLKASLSEVVAVTGHDSQNVDDELRSRELREKHVDPHKRAAAVMQAMNRWLEEQELKCA